MAKKNSTIGTIIALTLLVYFVGSNNDFLNIDISRWWIGEMYFAEASIFNQGAIKDSMPPELSIKDITTNIANGNIGNLSIIFNVFNPNKGTIILESISYNIYSNSTRIVSGDIGKQPEGFIDTQDNIFPIIGNGTLILKDKRIIENNNNLNLSRISGNNELQEFLVNGSYFFKQTSSFQATGGEQLFNFNYTRTIAP